jgi:hypothetical protein
MSMFNMPYTNLMHPFGAYFILPPPREARESAARGAKPMGRGV